MAAKMKDAVKAEDHISPVLESCVRCHQLEKIQEIKELFDSSLPQETLPGLIRLLSKYGKVDIAYSYFTQLKADGVRLNNSYSLNSLLESLLKHNCYSQAREVFDFHIKDQTLSSSDLITFSTMIKGCCKFGKMTEALELFQLVKEKELKTDEVLYNSLIDGCSKNKSLEKAFEIFDLMKADENVKPTTVSYNSLLDACVRSGEMAKAWKILDEMKDSNVVADNFTYSTLIKGIKRPEQVTDLEKAIAIFRELKEVYRQKMLKKELIVEDVDASGSIDEEAVLGDEDEDIQIEAEEKDEIEVVRPDEILFNVLIDSCINCRQLKFALELFDEIKREHMDGKSLISLDEISFNTIIKGCAQDKRLN